MRLAGALQREIAEALGVSRQAVSRLLGRIDSLVVKRMEADVSLVRRRQSLRLERLFDEAMRGWQWSLQARTTQATNMAIGGAAGVGSVWSELNETKPDPRFLAVALHVLAAERKVWRLDAKPKFESLQSGDLPEFLERELRRAYGRPAAEKQRDGNGISTGLPVETDL
jgi:DNA-binding Lrp family transcriptional regulator